MLNWGAKEKEIHFIENRMENLRETIKEAAGLYLKQLWEEIEEYFNIVSRIYNYAIRTELDIPRYKVLKRFNLVDNLYDPLYLPEILELAKYMKENNFEYFDSRWNTYGYFHHKHGYILKDLIQKLTLLSGKIKSARMQKLDKSIESTIQKSDDLILKSKKIFLIESLNNYDLIELEKYKEMINEAAYHQHFYKMIPVMLRTLFENLLWIIFRDSLDKKHIELYFNKHKSRVRDFSELIKLLDFLKENEFNPFCKNMINQNIIDILMKIKQIGNWSVHEVLAQVDPNFADEQKDSINRLLKALLVLYKSIKNKNIGISDDNVSKIKGKLWIRGKVEKEIMDLQVIDKEKEMDIVEKHLEARINGKTLIGGLEETFISIRAVNKSVRPIVINSYGLDIVEENHIVIINPFHSELKFLNTPLPWKLGDGESCNAYISRSAFKDIMKEQGWNYPLKVRAAFQTNDGKFYSKETIFEEFKI